MENRALLGDGARMPGSHPTDGSGNAARAPMGAAPAPMLAACHQRHHHRPIHSHLVKRLPRICMPSLVVWLDCLAGTTCSIFCLRQCEGAAAQICNVWWNFDPLAGYAQFEGGMAPVCQPARMIRLGKAVISVRVTLKNQLSTSSGSCTITGIVWSCSSNRPAPRGPGLMLGVQSAH